MPELSLIIPTYNERENLQALLEALAKALTFIDYEVIFVDDDSSDHTAAAEFFERAPYAHVGPLCLGINQSQGRLNTARTRQTYHCDRSRR